MPAFSHGVGMMSWKARLMLVLPELAVPLRRTIAPGSAATVGGQRIRPEKQRHVVAARSVGYSEGAGETKKKRAADVETELIVTRLQIVVDQPPDPAVVVGRAGADLSLRAVDAVEVHIDARRRATELDVEHVSGNRGAVGHLTFAHGAAIDPRG